jgi:Uma2 family endonuclease
MWIFEMLAETSIYTAQAYLQQERNGDIRHEYHQGEIFAMAGASRNHNRIVTNLSTILDTQLQNQPCNNW